MAAGIRVGLASRLLWNEDRKIKRVDAEGREVGAKRVRRDCDWAVNCSAGWRCAEAQADVEVEDTGSSAGAT